MEKLSIFENIEIKSKEEVSAINNDAEISSKNEYEKIIANSNETKEKMLNNANKNALGLVNQKKNEYDLIEKQFVNKVQREVLDSIEVEVVKTLMDMKKEKLTDLICDLIKKEDVKGDEVILVSKKDYPKYQEALSSSKGALVEADLINKRINTKFKLSNEAADIKNGFILVGNDYDLSFEYNNLVESALETFEKELSEYLFG